MKEGIERENRKGIHDLHFIFWIFARKHKRRKKLKGIERELCHVSLLKNTTRKKWKEKFERESMLYTLNFFPENYTTRREEMEGKKAETQLHQTWLQQNTQ